MRALTVSLCLLLSLLATGCAGDPAAPKRKVTSLVPPSVSGGLTPAQVQASFIVRPDGLPDSVQLIRNDFQNPELDLAVTKMVETMSFPSARSDTFVKAFPLYFR